MVSKNEHGDFIVLTSYHTENIEKSYAIVQLLERLAKEVFLNYSGFGSSTLHLSQNGLRVYAYDFWREKSDFLNALAAPEAEAITRKIVPLALGIDPVVCSHEAQIISAAPTFCGRA